MSLRMSDCFDLVIIQALLFIFMRINEIFNDVTNLINIIQNVNTAENMMNMANIDMSWSGKE